MTLKISLYQEIIIMLILILIMVSGTQAMAISYSSSSGGFSSSTSGSSLSLGNSLNIQSSSVISGSGSKPGSTGVGNESESFTVDDPPSSDPDFGDVRVVSSPPGAEVLMNEFLQTNLTPTLITLLNPGKYSFVIKMEGYDPFVKELDVGKGKQKTIVADFDGNYSKKDATEGTPVPKPTKETGIWV